MIEMFGVLAIVGVLSVGGIAGYTKAMHRYKIYKQTDQLITVFDAMIRNLEKFETIPIKGTFTSILIKLGEIPDDMIKKAQQDSIYDSFGIGYYTYVYSEMDRVAIFGQIDSSEPKQIGCENVYKISQQYASRLRYITIVVGGNTMPTDYYYGDDYCDGTSKKCLKDIKLTEFDGICNYCQEGQGCRIYIVF